MKKVKIVAAGIALAALLAVGIPRAGSGAGPEPYEISVILGLTGPATFIGQAQQASLKVLEDVVNKSGGISGRPVHFTFLDDQTSPQVAVQIANQVLAKNPSVFIGSDLAATCRAIEPLVKTGPVDYCVSPAIYPDKDSYTFSSSVSTRDEIYTFVKYFRERGWTRIARLTTTDASGQDSDHDFADALGQPENKAMTIVSSERFNPTDVSVAAQVARIKAANPQVIVVWAPGTPFGLALQTLKNAGIEDIPIATTGANMTLAQMKQYGGIMPQSLYFSAVGYIGGIAGSRQGQQAVKTFLDAMKAHDVGVDFQTGMAWDPAMIVVNALRANGTTASPEKIHTWLENLHGWSGISGTYDFRDGSQRGLTQADVVVLRWDHPSFKWIAVSKPGGELR
jgi:branched-chain amino acid transport system substrate-binding protein